MGSKQQQLSGLNGKSAFVQHCQVGRDWSYKECVSSEPDVKCIDLDGSEELVILASDGLWDTISHYDAYDIVMGTLFMRPRDADIASPNLLPYMRSD
ncbi:unnamed protein product [Notodromas monacha]|uniref:PPM-type phosphatase domain-containing protein n=1 Tax=Notodromas monacha TaxID=399045 RepID=A0A7R9GBF0_9CRUS|nr:unnamed protein product [Notodromas monacha]CAG0916291.1 unnamed protein product [Notodromas monacha]